MKAKELLQLVVFLMWIPLSIAAFLLSPVRIDIKLFSLAGASFIAMIIWFAKD